jgi:hypothetical protein
MILDTKEEIVIIRCDCANGVLAMTDHLGGGDLKPMTDDPPTRSDTYLRTEPRDSSSTRA